MKVRQTTRAEFEVYPLGNFCAMVEAPPGINLENILIRLLPTKKYTTPDAAGQFCFYNLREGNYEVELAPESLPKDTRPAAPLKSVLILDLATPPNLPRFSLEKVVAVQPVRKVLEEKVIHIGSR